MHSHATRDGRADRALREAAFSAAMLAITALAAFSIGRDLWRLVAARHDDPGRLAWEGVFLFVIAVLLYGNVVFLVSRLGYDVRRHRHTPAAFESLVQDHWSGAEPIAVLVPSYKEDRRTVWQTLLSATLQHYPKKRVVLLLDDPIAPADRESRELQAAARDMPRAIAQALAAPRAMIRQRRDAFLAEAGTHGAARAADVAHLTHLQDDLVDWLQEQAAASDLRDHTERHFVAVTYEAHARLIKEAKQALADRFCTEGVSRAEVLAGIDRLRDVFATEVSVFERKRYANLSHEPSKAANLNAYISLLGRRVVERVRGRERHLVDGREGESHAVDIPDATYVLTLDADSMLEPVYALRLAAEFAGEANQRLAVVQTPYTAIPGAPGTLERIAGATTDMQYIVHQGFTWASATFWVGANALLRKSALDDIRVEERQGDLVVPKYIQDRTVIEDTESTVDLAAKGWELRNYPERLAFSATPPDFGSLLIQRARWANGGLLIVPNLVRYLLVHRFHPRAVASALVRFHYLSSIATGSLAMLLLMIALVIPVDSSLYSMWLPVMGAAYLLPYWRDMRRMGYRHGDILRVSAFNVMLVPINLAGVNKSLRQAVTGLRTPFARTPKVEGRTAAPTWAVLSIWALLAWGVLAFVVNLLAEEPLQAFMALATTAGFGYAAVAFVGLGEGWEDVARSLPDPARRRSDAARSDD